MRKGARKPGLVNKIKVRFTNSLEWLSAVFSFVRIGGTHFDQVIDKKVWQILRSKTTGNILGGLFKWPVKIFTLIFLLTISTILMEKIPALDELSRRDKSFIMMAIILCLVSSFFVWNLARGRKEAQEENASDEPQPETSLKDVLSQDQDEDVGEGKILDTEKAEEIGSIKLFNGWFYAAAAILVVFLVLVVGQKFFFSLGIILALSLLLWSISVIRRKSAEKKSVVFPGLMTAISLAMIVSLSYLMFREGGCDPDSPARCQPIVTVTPDVKAVKWTEVYPLPDRLPADTQFVMVVTKERRSPKIVIPLYYGIEFNPFDSCIDVYTQLGGPFTTCRYDGSVSGCQWSRLKDPEIVQVASQVAETRFKVRLYDSRVATSQRVC